MIIFPSMNGVDTVPTDDKKIYTVHSLEEYIKILDELLNDESPVVFRGHSDKDWKLKSSGDRNELHIHDYYKIWLDCYKNNYNIIQKENFLDNVVNMQHYMLPTKLLDWSYNPLTALYFAVEENPYCDKKDGEVIVAYPHEIYEPDSDEIKALSIYLYKVYHNKGNVQDQLELFHLLRCNRYIFFCVAQSNKRIQAQAGLFSVALDISDEKIVEETEQEIERIIGNERNDNDEMNAYKAIKTDYQKRLGIKALDVRFFRNIEKNKDTIKEKYPRICNVLPQIEKFWLWNYYRLPNNDIGTDVKKIQVPSDCKNKIRDDLERFCNIHARTIYPDFLGYTEFIRKSCLKKNRH